MATTEALSFWGGVDPATGVIIDVHHPLHGQSLTGRILMMPSSRGSCTGSGVLLDLALTGRGPAALIFSGDEDVLTLGALIAAEMFGCNLPVLRLSDTAYTALAAKDAAQITADRIEAVSYTHLDVYKRQIYMFEVLLNYIRTNIRGHDNDGVFEIHRAPFVIR